MSEKIETINSPEAPKAVGPYSHAVRVGNTLYCSGQIPLDPSTSKLVEGAIIEQTKQVFSNISAVLSTAGLTSLNVVKTTVFLQDLSDFAAMNTLYAEYFGAHKPARSTVQVSKLPLGSLIEIEVLAVY